MNKSCESIITSKTKIDIRTIKYLYARICLKQILFCLNITIKANGLCRRIAIVKLFFNAMPKYPKVSLKYLPSFTSMVSAYGLSALQIQNSLTLAFIRTKEHKIDCFKNILKLC